MRREHCHDLRLVPREPTESAPCGFVGRVKVSGRLRLDRRLSAPLMARGGATPWRAVARLITAAVELGAAMLAATAAHAPPRDRLRTARRRGDGSPSSPSPGKSSPARAPGPARVAVDRLEPRR